MLPTMSNPCRRGVSRTLAGAFACAGALILIAAPSAGAAALTPIHASPHPSGGLSTAAIVIAVIAGLLALGCAAWAIARAQAFEPHWLLSARHTMSEVGFRASSTWSEFSDWVRLGR
jgi:hypothetical protein